MSEKIDKKYPAMSKEDIEKDIARQEKAKTKYSMDTVEVEKALTEYMDILDPLLWENPKTGEEKAIAWIRRPSMKELKGLVPPELNEYVGKRIPEDVAKKYEKFFYRKMAEMIAIPERTAEQWEEKANPWFIRRFWQHIADIASLMEGQIEGF